MPLFNDSALAWLIAGGVVLAAFLLLITVPRTVRGYHTRMLQTPETDIPEIPLQVLRQAINVGLHRKFAELGIEFAYPTQKLFATSLDQTPQERRAA